jgi:Fungal specific transcription factor domain
VAVRDDNLLHLLLAYSASHRARLLKHPEPSNRIAIWVRDVFPNLRKALDDTAGRISNSNLATAIMLASLEIIAPNAFEVPVPWQDHLAIARGMIIARGGPRSVNRYKDRVSYFLIRWFAYLDVFGNFSSTGVRADQAMFSGDLYDFEDQDDFQIDCVLGFSGRLAGLLARAADLARRCDSERIDASGNLDESWQPPPDIIETARILKSDLLATRNVKYRLCPHRQPGTEFDVAWEAMEMSATNEAFLWAGLIHLNRRVLAQPQDSEDVQQAVREVIGTLYRVRKGGSAEACLLFPLFTAGCEARDPSQRETILERVRSVEESGMTQVRGNDRPCVFY